MQKILVDQNFPGVPAVASFLLPGLLAGVWAWRFDSADAEKLRSTEVFGERLVIDPFLLPGFSGIGPRT